MSKPKSPAAKDREIERLTAQLAERDATIAKQWAVYRDLSGKVVDLSMQLGQIARISTGVDE